MHLIIFALFFGVRMMVKTTEIWQKTFDSPNGPYPLWDARLNFEKHGYMYGFGDGIEVVEEPNATRQRLLDYVPNVS